MSAIPGMKAPINDMVVNKKGRVLLSHSSGEQRWLYPVDGKELISVNPSWSFVSKHDHLNSAKNAVVVEQPGASEAIERPAKPAIADKPRKQVESALPAEKPKVETRIGAIRGSDE